MKLYSLSCIRAQRLHERLRSFPVGRHSYCPCSWLFIAGSLRWGETTTKGWVASVWVSGREWAGRSPCKAPCRGSAPWSAWQPDWAAAGMWRLRLGSISFLLFLCFHFLSFCRKQGVSTATLHPHPTPPRASQGTRRFVSSHVPLEELWPEPTYFFHVSHPHHISPQPHTFRLPMSQREATLHKVENVRSILTKIKTCWSL